MKLLAYLYFLALGFKQLLVTRLQTQNLLQFVFYRLQLMRDMAYNKDILVCFVIFTFAFRIPSYQCLSVSFPFKGDLYVAEGREMSLKAAFQKDPSEKIIIVTWELKNDEGPVRRLATRMDSTEEPLDQHHSTWREAVMTADMYGSYTITVTKEDGTQKAANVNAKKNDASPVATISLHCDMARDRAQWDSPRFSWLVDGLSVSHKTANLSEDGSQLYLTGKRGHNYTCIVDSSLGTSTLRYITDATECPASQPGWSLWICLGALIVLTVLVVSLLRECRRRKRAVRQTGE